jgi:hypothetical protein
MNGNPTAEEPWSEEELIGLGQLYSIGIPIEQWQNSWEAT